MSKTINQRMTVLLDDDFVVFLIGMRINHPWKLNNWLPATLAMPGMLRELSKDPETGFLGYQLLGGVPPVIVQYWKSFEMLEAYARNLDAKHYPAWKRYNQKIKNNGDVGIWHETYKVRAGQYECIYNNMPMFGLGKVGELVPAAGIREHAKDRIAART